jgi:hypothetical protein
LEAEVKHPHGGSIVAQQKRGTRSTAKFQRGDKVRMKHGVNDTDYPDMPIGGWAGIIAGSATIAL